MKQLIVICGLITVVIGMACISTMIIGQSQLPIDLVRAAGLDYCNNQICFRGIALGTDWGIAMEKLTPNVNDFRRYTIQVNMTDAVYVMTPLDSNQSLVGQIEVGPTSGFALRLGDIVGQYGAPCLVSYLAPAPGDVQINLIYPLFDVVTVRYDAAGKQGPWALDPGMSVAYAEFYLGSGSCAVPEQYPNNAKLAAWQGFTNQYAR